MSSASFRSQSSNTLSDRAATPPKESRLKQRNTVKEKKKTQLDSVLESNDDDDPIPDGCVELSLRHERAGHSVPPLKAPIRGF